MYTKHRNNILKYELNFGEGAALGINRRQQAKVTSMEDSFKPAYDLLISKYVTDELQGFNPGIDCRDIQVANNTTGSSLEGSIRDGMVVNRNIGATEQNDLIIGRGGDDTIKGGGGRDIFTWWWRW